MPSHPSSHRRPVKYFTVCILHFGLALALSAQTNPARSRQFSYPRGIALDSAGNIYVADSGSDTIQKLTAAGAVTTLAGMDGVRESTDGTGSAARFSGPAGAALDSAGNIYVTDTFNQTIRKITPAGAVTTLAGTPGVSGTADGTGGAAQFSGPSGVAVDKAGNLYLADTGNSVIRKITPAGVVTTLAGTVSNPGHADGTGGAARFNSPRGVALDGAGNLYVADQLNNVIRKMTPAGAVTTLAGQPGSPGRANGTGTAAEFNGPKGVAVDGAGNVYVADTVNSTIRKVTSAGVVTTLAGIPGSRGTNDGAGSAAKFSAPYSLALDSAGNLYVADAASKPIRKITPEGKVTTLPGLSGN